MSKPIERWEVTFASDAPSRLLREEREADEVIRYESQYGSNRAQKHRLIEDRGEREALERVLKAWGAWRDVDHNGPTDAFMSARSEWVEAIAAGWAALKGET